MKFKNNNTPSMHISVEPQLLNEAMSLIDQAVLACTSDEAAYLNERVIKAFSYLRAHDRIAFEKQRLALKNINPRIRLSALDAMVRQGGGNVPEASASLAAKLSDLLHERCELWRNADDVPFASFEREHSEHGEQATHLEHWPLESVRFRDLISLMAYSELGCVASNEAIQSTINSLAASAKFDGELHESSLRIARTAAGYWIDICNDKWQAILVTSSGWRIVDDPEVRFTRSKSMRSLPIPVRGGKVDDLWCMVNIQEEDRLCALAFLLECFRPETPHVLTEFTGPQGSSKTTTQRAFKRLVDPNKSDVNAAPRSRDELFIIGKNNHAISLENMSGLSPDFSDALCTITTGGGLSGRKLYTNDDENIISVHNPVMLNGISTLVVRPDLLDRSIIFYLPAIKERLSDAEVAELQRKFLPGVFGGLLEIFAGTLQKLPEVHIPKSELPRMADFALLGEAMSRFLGFPEGSFLHDYQARRKDAVRRVVDASPVAIACMKLLERDNYYSGTIGNLLVRLNGAIPQRGEREDWPKSPRGLGDALRRYEPALLQLGIIVHVDSRPKRDGYHCILKYADQDSSAVLGA